MKAIKNVILDLGGVIINIDPMQTAEYLSAHGVNDIETFFARLEEARVFERVELGKINEEEMLDEIRRLIPNSPPREILRASWNSLLLDIPAERGAIVQRLAAKYPLYLLSNTSPGHIAIIDDMVQRQFAWKSLREPFVHAFYSYEMGTRKPEGAIYAQMLEESGLNPEESVFLDDTLANLEKAREFNLQTRLVTPQNGLVEIAENELL